MPFFVQIHCKIDDLYFIIFFFWPFIRCVSIFSSFICTETNINRWSELESGLSLNLLPPDTSSWIQIISHPWYWNVKWRMQVSWCHSFITLDWFAHVLYMPSKRGRFQRISSQLKRLFVFALCTFYCVMMSCVSLLRCFLFIFFSSSPLLHLLSLQWIQVHRFYNVYNMYHLVSFYSPLFWDWKQLRGKSSCNSILYCPICFFSNTKV